MASIVLRIKMPQYSRFDQKKFLIIGGTSKAGTTSLYQYLARHPEIYPSLVKETRFFLDAEYPLPRKNFFCAGLEKYTEFFPGWKNHKKVLMEATPDYLYSKTALEIATLLPNAKMLFILRDPTDRLVSWYKYAKQRAMLPPQTSFDEYVDAQLNQPITQDTPVCYRALEQGRYEKYVSLFKQAFGERLLIMSFDELRVAPVEFMRQVCSFSGLRFDYYEDYKFKIYNKSKKNHFPKISEWLGSFKLFLR